MASNAVQQLAQQLEAAGVTESEAVIAVEPWAFPSVPEDTTRIAAYLLWEAAGAVEDSPYTLNFWLEAEDVLKTQTPTQPAE